MHMTRRDFFNISTGAALTLAGGPLALARTAAPVRDPLRPVFRKGVPTTIYIPMTRGEGGCLQIYARNEANRLARVEGGHKFTLSNYPFQIIRDQRGTFFTDYLHNGPPRKCGALWIKDPLGGYWHIFGDIEPVSVIPNGLSFEPFAANRILVRFTPTACVSALYAPSFVNG